MYTYLDERNDFRKILKYRLDSKNDCLKNVFGETWDDFEGERTESQWQKKITSSKEFKYYRKN